MRGGARFRRARAARARTHAARRASAITPYAVRWKAAPRATLLYAAAPRASPIYESIRSFVCLRSAHALRRSAARRCRHMRALMRSSHA